MFRSIIACFLLFSPFIFKNSENYMPKSNYQHEISCTDNGEININGNIIKVNFSNLSSNEKWEQTTSKNQIILTCTNNQNTVYSIILDLSNYYFPKITTNIKNNKETEIIKTKIIIKTKDKGSIIYNNKKFKNNEHNKYLYDIEWIAKKHNNEIIAIKTQNKRVILNKNEIIVNLEDKTELDLHVSNLNAQIIQSQTEFKSLDKTLDFGMLKSFNNNNLIMINGLTKYTKNIFISICLTILCSISMVWPNIYESIINSQKLIKAQPEIDAVSEEFKNNKQKQWIEIQKIYDRYGINLMQQLAGQILLFIPFYVVKNISVSLNHLLVIGPKYNLLIIAFLLLALVSYYSIFLEKKSIILGTLTTISIYYYYYQYLNILLLAIMHFELIGLYLTEKIKQKLNKKNIKI